MRYLIFLAMILFAGDGLAQTDEERAAKAVANIAELLENRDALRAEAAEIEAQSDAAAALPTGEARKARVAELRRRLQEIDARAAAGADGGEDANIEELQAEKTDVQAELQLLQTSSKAEAEDREARLQEIRAELTKLSRQISAVATGVSEEEYGLDEDAAFDLNAEAQALVDPSSRCCATPLKTPAKSNACAAI